NLSGVSLVGGKFKRKNAKCEVATGFGQSFYKHEEKETDVNLAVSLVSNACVDNFDIAIVITSDSDLCPPINYVRKNF
ncbi:NYN domain-containing protein, partial [Pantoea eucalypti]|uniref:NYN domain-containing protein n=1 Tax=Pantoea eucalypti TaxID=470933 RepID=UPI003FA43BC5